MNGVLRCHLKIFAIYLFSRAYYIIPESGPCRVVDVPSEHVVPAKDGGPASDVFPCQRDYTIAERRRKLPGIPSIRAHLIDKGPVLFFFMLCGGLGQSHLSRRIQLLKDFLRRHQQSLPLFVAFSEPLTTIFDKPHKIFLSISRVNSGQLGETCIFLPLYDQDTSLWIEYFFQIPFQHCAYGLTGAYHLDQQFVPETMVNAP